MTVNEKYAFAPIRQLAGEIQAGRVSPVDLTEMFLARIERLDPQLNSFITVAPDIARQQAKQAETEIRAGRYRGLLHGIPWGVKDIYDTKGLRTTWGSPIYKDRIPDYDSTAVARLREAGAVLLGKLSTNEFAGGARHLQGQTHNPWKLDRTPAGSSAGPGAATAGGLVVFSLGSETGGSIMGPSGVNGVTGMVPTYGRVSRYGVMALCWSLDKCGPLCRTADDVGIVLNAIAGADPNDPTCRHAPFPWSGPPSGNIRGKKLGVVRAEFAPAERAGTKPLFDAALQKLSELGVQMEDVELKEFPYADVYGLTNNAEAAGSFEDLIRGGRFDEFANSDRGNPWAAGLSITAVDYLRAQRIRTDIIRYAKSLFETYDALVAPNNVTPAGLINNGGGGGRAGGGRGAVPNGQAQRYLTSLENLTGVTYISTRVGFHDDLPICIKFVAAPMGEATAIELAYAYEKVTTWNARTPEYKA